MNTFPFQLAAIGLVVLMTGCTKTDVVEPASSVPSTENEGGEGPGNGVIHTLSPSQLNRLCPEHLSGDEHFTSSVDMLASVELFLQGDRQVWMRTTFDLQEPDQDGTHARLVQEDLIHEVEPGSKIRRIVTNEMAEWMDTLVEQGEVRQDFSDPDSPVERFQVKALTPGSDVGACNGNRAYLTVKFNSIRIEVLED